MTSSTGRRTLPIRRWLALALPVIFFTPVLVTLTVIFAWIQLPQFSRFDAAERLLANASRWSDPAWQETARDELADQGVSFVLIEDGRELYRSASEPIPSGEPGSLVQRVEVEGTGSTKTALVYAELGGRQYRRAWLIPLVGLTTLLATLVVIAWILGRTVVRPLAAASRAAQQVAAGNLDVKLPSSRVREVAEVTTAFDTMTRALRTSVEHEAQLEQERRLFIGAVVHDLRTPLFSLRGALEGLEQGIADTPEKVDRYVALARERASALERLIGDLFAFTRLEYLEQTPQREPLDLSSLVRHVIGGLEPLAASQEIAMLVRAPSEPVMISGDEHLLTRAIENLVDNALRYTPRGGSITIDIDSTQDACRFSVSDTGPGIPAEQIPHLFTPLYRGESSRNRSTGGAGLGLTIARRILLAHGGSLTAENRQHVGARFTATLPRMHPARSE